MIGSRSYVWVVLGHDLGGNGGTVIEGIYATEYDANDQAAILRQEYTTKGARYYSEWSGVDVERHELKGNQT